MKSYIQINIYGRNLNELQCKGVDLQHLLERAGCPDCWIGELPIYKQNVIVSDVDREFNISSGAEKDKEDEIIDLESPGKLEISQPYGNDLYDSLTVVKEPPYSTPIYSAMNNVSRLSWSFSRIDSGYLANEEHNENDGYSYGKSSEVLNSQVMDYDCCSSVGNYDNMSDIRVEDNHANHINELIGNLLNKVCQIMGPNINKTEASDSNISGQSSYASVMEYVDNPNEPKDNSEWISLKDSTLYTEASDANETATIYLVEEEDSPEDVGSILDYGYNEVLDRNNNDENCDINEKNKTFKAPKDYNTPKYIIKCQFPGCKVKHSWRVQYGKQRLLDHAIFHNDVPIMECRNCTHIARTTRLLREHYKKEHRVSISIKTKELLSVPLTAKKIEELWKIAYGDQLDIVGLPRILNDSENRKIKFLRKTRKRTKCKKLQDITPN